MGEVQKAAKRFRKEYRIREVTADSLKHAFMEQGFTLIEYERLLNSPDVETVVHHLGLEPMLAHSNGFIYMSELYRIVFLFKGLTDSEQKLILAHEEGHYCLGHSNSIVGRAVTEEYEANEFAHYLLKKSLKDRISEFLKQHKRMAFAVLLAIGLLLAGGTALKREMDRRVYEGEYYVTEHGTKYHLENCVTIQGHKVRRLKKEDAGEYEPCGVCMP